MIPRKWQIVACILFVSYLAVVSIDTNKAAVFARTNPAQQLAPPDFISAEELKSKLAKNEPVAIIDVRGSTGLLLNDNKIKGAVYVKLRRLKYRLAFAPLNAIPRDREVITYCACPNDESSIRAAQILADSGFKRVRVLKGGWVGWKKNNGQIEPMARGL